MLNCWGAGDLTHPPSGLMKPEEGFAQVLSNDEELGEGKGQKNQFQMNTDKIGYLRRTGKVVAPSLCLRWTGQ